MVERHNLCAQIPLPLFNRVGAEREKSGLTNAEYITHVLTEYFEWKENGGTTMAKNSGKDRTLAFQISEDLFNRIKAYLERETARTGQKLTQKDFVIGLIEAKLAEAEQAEAERREAGEAESAVSAESVPKAGQETEQESAEAEAESGGDEEAPYPSEPEEEAGDEAASETAEDNGQTEDTEDASPDNAAT